MKIFFLFIVSLLSACAVSVSDAWYHIEGVINDSNGKPIQGATIEYNGMKSESNTYGCFVIDFVNGTNSAEIIKVSHPKYKSLIISKFSTYPAFNINLPELNSNNEPKFNYRAMTGDEAFSSRPCNT